MAKAKKVNPEITVDGSTRPMTDEEFSDYTKVLEESKVIIDNKINSIKAKETAIAKLVSLGLTEEDIRLAGL